MSDKVMRCKLLLHSVEDMSSFGGKNKDGSKLVHKSSKVRFGAVWEGSPELQAKSENAIFGDMTPQAEFVATIKNQEVVANLEVGKAYYVDFIPVNES